MKDNGDGTVIDESTSLMWQQETLPPQLNWADSIQFCSRMTLGGHTDWRLPTIKELQSLVDYSRCSPTINTTYFPNTASSLYWSTTTSATNTNFAWGVYFDYGFNYMSNKNYRLYVRAVRGGV